MVTYDVVLSFAGEDRKYVEKIAYLLKSHGVKVFYDKFETSTLWGKDLYQYLNEIYKNKAKYCVAFISSNYIRKNWTLLELKSAQARDFECENEYILPIYLERVTVPGLNITTGYLNANEYSYDEIVGFIEEKLDYNIDKKELYNELRDYLSEFVISYILIGGKKEVYFFEEIRNNLKSFLLSYAFDLNQEIYLACCAMVNNIEEKFSVRKERCASTEENVVENFADAIDIYSKLKKMISIINYYIDNKLDDNIDFFSVCEENGFYDKNGEEEFRSLADEIMDILIKYQNECNT